MIDFSYVPCFMRVSVVLQERGQGLGWLTAAGSKVGAKRKRLVS